MVVSSSSTYDEVLAAYRDNIGYDLAGSVSMCREFIRACRMLCVLRPSRSGHNGSYAEFDPKQLAAAENAAMAWLAQNAAAPASTSANGVKHVNFGDFRG